MRRSLVVSLALLAMANAPAVAQTCMGLASYKNAPIQVTGNASFTQGVNSWGGSVGYGIPASVFGNLGASTTSIDGAPSSSLGLNARVGYQIDLGTSRQAQLCPTASFGIEMGPDDEAADINGSSTSATLGLAVGTIMGANPRMKIIPSVGLAYAYGKVKAENGTGTTLFEISDNYGLAQLGVGIIFNANISVRPSVDVPLGLEGSDPTFGLTVGYNFGRKH